MSKLELDLSKVEVIKELVNRESGLYGTVNDEGEKVVVMVEHGEGLEIITYQNNGWVRKDFYSKNGLKTDEMYDGRWNK